MDQQRSWEAKEHAHMHGLDAKPRNLWELLTHTHCADLIQHQQPVVLDSKMSIEDACEVRELFEDI
jgi:hypothetical protein